MAWLVGMCWGALVAVPIVRVTRRRQVSARLAVMRTVPDESPEPWFWRRRFHGPGRPGALTTLGRLGGGPVWRVVASLRARRRSVREDSAIRREIPIVVDLLAVAVGAGCSPFLAAGLAAEWAPPIAAARFRGALRACELGERVVDALAGLGAHPLLVPVADVLVAAEDLGTPALPALRRLATTARADARRRAEAHARVVPVRLLFPLVFLVLPAFALLTVVPALLGGLARV